MKPLNDRQKKLAAVGVGGLLFLVFMLARGRNAANTSTVPTSNEDPSAFPTATGGGAGQSDFGSDNTGYLADLTNSVSGGLGSLNQGLSTLGDNQGVLNDHLVGVDQSIFGLSGALAAQQSSVDALTNRLSDAIDATPATGGIPGPAADPGQGAATAVAVAQRVAAPAAAVQPKTVVKNGRVYHFYDTDPKKAGAERKVYVRPADAAARKPSTKPKATHHAPAARATPLHKPSAHKPAPVKTKPAKPAKPKTTHKRK